MGSKRTLRLITWDVHNTLIRTKQSIGALYNLAAARHGLHCSSDALDCEFKKAFGMYSKEFPNYGRHAGMSSRTWWCDVVKRTFMSTGVSDEKLDELAAELFQNFTLPSHYLVYPDVLHTLQQLRLSGIPLGVVSNFDSRLSSILDGLGLQDFFDFMVCPDTCGSSKPDTGIFQEVLRISGETNPNLVVHIGDSIDKDYVPAQALGFRAFLVIRDDNKRQSALEHRAVDGRHVFSDLSKLIVELLK